MHTAEVRGSPPRRPDPLKDSLKGARAACHSSLFVGGRPERSVVVASGWSVES